MFKIGDKVQIMDEDRMYTLYTDMAKLMELNHFVKGIPRDIEGEFQVLAKSYHPQSGKVVYGIVCGVTGNQFIVSEDGLESYVEETYSLGSRWISPEGCEYILCSPLATSLCLINLKTGARWSTIVSVLSNFNFTKKQLQNLNVISEGFTPVPERLSVDL